MVERPTARLEMVRLATLELLELIHHDDEDVIRSDRQSLDLRWKGRTTFIRPSSRDFERLLGIDRLSLFRIVSEEKNEDAVIAGGPGDCEKEKLKPA